MMNIRCLLLLVSVFIIVACGGGGGGATYHIAISHTGNGLTCESETVTLILHEDNASHTETAVEEDEDVTISLKLDGVAVGSPFIVTVPDGESRVSFAINQTTAGSLDIDAVGDNASAPDGGSEDLPIVFSDAGFRFYVNGFHTGTTPISTQVGGKLSTQTLTLRAIESNSDTGACEAAVVGATAVEIAYECENPTSCSSNQLSFTGSGPAVGVTGSANQSTFNFSSPSSNFTTVPMSFDGSGEASFSFLFNDVGQIKLHAKSTLPSSGPTLTGSSNAFVVRPFGLYVYADGDTLAVDGTGGGYKKVGEKFSIGVKGVLYESTDDSNADGIPNGYPGSIPADYADLSGNAVAPNFGNESIGEEVTLTVENWLPSAGTLGTFAGGTEVTVFSNGAGVNNSDGTDINKATYSKVGLIDIIGTIKDGDYLGVDATSGVDAIYGKSGYVGRFTPDHYELSVSSGTFDSACNNFTYIGQAFSYAISSQPTITVTAKDSAGNTLQNYLGLGGGAEGFKKLSVTSMQPMDSTTPFTVTSNNIGADAVTAMPVTAVYQSPSIADDGSLAYLSVFTLSASDSFTYTRNANAEVASYDMDLPLTITGLTDSDTIGALHAAGAVDSDGNNIAGLPIDTTNPFIVTMAASGEKQFFGRFRLENAFGPETAPLGLPVNTEYLTGTGFVINTNDNCTSLAAGNFDLNVIDDDAVDDDGDSATDNPVPGDIIGIVIDGSSTTGTFNDPFNAGEAGFSFSAPGAGSTAAIEVELLDTASDYPWLLYNWDNVDQLSDGDMLDDLPSSTATFGRFRGHDNIIYWQETTN